MALMVIESAPGRAPRLQEMMAEWAAISLADMMVMKRRAYRVWVYVRDERDPNVYRCTHTAEAQEPVQGGGVPG